MLYPIYTKQFSKDVNKIKKQGKDTTKLRKVIEKLISQEKLEVKYRDHKLIGDFKSRRECHIEPDWLLIYKIDDNDIIFERTGSHSNLFKK